MSGIEPGAYLMYDGVLHQVIGIGQGRSVILDPVGASACPTCGRVERLHLLTDSRLFREHVEPVPTIGAP